MREGIAGIRPGVARDYHCEVLLPNRVVWPGATMVGALPQGLQRGADGQAVAYGSTG